MISPQEAADKWAQNLGRAGAAYVNGINRVSVNPMEEAAKNQAGYLAGVQRAVDSGKWQRGLRRRSKEEWQTAATQTGAARLQQGATKGKGKMSQFLDTFLPFVAAGQAKVKSMPKGTLQDRINRAVAMMEHNASFKRS